MQITTATGRTVQVYMNNDNGITYRNVKDGAAYGPMRSADRATAKAGSVGREILNAIDAQAAVEVAETVAPVRTARPIASSNTADMTEVRNRIRESAAAYAEAAGCKPFTPVAQAATETVAPVTGTAPQLIKAQAKGAVITAGRHETDNRVAVEYDPRYKGDRSPWLYREDERRTYRYATAQCRAEYPAPAAKVATVAPAPAKGQAVFKADGRWGTVLDGVVMTGRRKGHPGFGRRYVSVLWTTAENGAPQPSYGFVYLDEIIRIVAAPSASQTASETAEGVLSGPVAGTSREARTEVQKRVRAALIRNAVGLRFE